MSPESLDGKNYSLDVLCKRFDIVTKDRHTALGDAFLTALLFMKLIRLFEKKGIKTLKQLL
jgi:DNA polymerase-3 subunit epsilon